MIFLLTSGYSNTQSILKLIGLIILCALIIAASYFVTRLIGRRESGMIGNSNFKAVDAYRLTPNKYLQIIRIGKRYFCIAVSKDDVRLICELSEDDIEIKSRSEKMLSFKEIMAKATGKKNGVGADETADCETEVITGNGAYEKADGETGVMNGNGTDGKTDCETGKPADDGAYEKAELENEETIGDVNEDQTGKDTKI